jgi:hypothetical protein
MEPGDPEKSVHRPLPAEGREGTWDQGLLADLQER